MRAITKPLNTGCATFLALVVAAMAPAPARPQAPSTAEKPTDLLELMGIKHPEGDQLERMIAQAAAHPLGTTQNPVRVAGIDGQRAYLSRLRCANDDPPKFKRTFSAGIGPFGRIMDEYAVVCGRQSHRVYLDMYHRHREDRPIAGFTIVRGRPGSAVQVTHPNEAPGFQRFVSAQSASLLRAAQRARHAFPLPALGVDIASLGPSGHIAGRRNFAMALWTIRASYDPEARAWYAVDSDLPGVAADAESLESLAAKVGAMLPDLLEIHAARIADPARLAGPHSIRIIAHHERDFPVAA